MERIPVEDVDVFYQMFVKLPERSPFLEELVLGVLESRLELLESFRNDGFLVVLKLKDDTKYLYKNNVHFLNS